MVVEVIFQLCEGETTPLVDEIMMLFVLYMPTTLRWSFIRFPLVNIILAPSLPVLNFIP